MINTILVYTILIGWSVSIISFFTSVFIGCFLCDKDHCLLDKVDTWPKLFAAISGKHGTLTAVYGVFYFFSILAAIIAFAAFLIGGFFCSYLG